MIEVLDHRLTVVASCATPDAAEAAARLLGAAWMRQEGAAWTMAVRVVCPNCEHERDRRVTADTSYRRRLAELEVERDQAVRDAADMREELHAVARVRP